MANYGRGWDDGYGGQSPEAIDAYQEREAIEAGRMQTAAAQRGRERDRATHTFRMAECAKCGKSHWACAVENGSMVRRCVGCGFQDRLSAERA